MVGTSQKDQKVKKVRNQERGRRKAKGGKWRTWENDITLSFFLILFLDKKRAERGNKGGNEDKESTK